MGAGERRQTLVAEALREGVGSEAYGGLRVACHEEDWWEGRTGSC